MIAVCTTCDRVEVMIVCACGGVVVQLPGWVRRRPGDYVLGVNADVSVAKRPPALGRVVANPTSVGARWDTTVYGEWRDAAHATAATAFQAVMAELAELNRRVDAMIIGFLVENGRADEAHDETHPR
jgi:hypothetical protein